VDGRLGRWPGPTSDYPVCSLGYQVAAWIEDRCAIPDREQQGDKLLLTDEQARFIVEYYRLDPQTGQFVYFRGAQLTRPQKWGKGPLAAAIICAEAAGPVRFDHWVALEETPAGVVGKPVATPLIQITALSEEQAQNVYSALLPMIELGALGRDVEDTGLGRINLPAGGKIEWTTAAAVSRLGQRITFVVQDQTESWLATNGGRKLADNQRRNLAGMNARWLSTPNAWDPTEESVAQYTAENEHDGVLHDDVTPAEGLSIRNQAERRRALRAVYGDAVTGHRLGHRQIKPWINLDRIEAEITALLPRDPAQAERWFLNRKEAPESKAFNGAHWDELADPHEIPAGELIVVGVDGARFADGLGMIATDVLSGYQWPLGIWERPQEAGDEYEHPLHEVDGALAEAMRRWEVWRVYIDPQYIDHLVTKWQGEYGEKRVIEWFTNRPRQMAWAVRNYSQAFAARDFRHSGDEDFTRHIKNAVRRKVTVYDDDHRQMYVIAKDRPDSPRKMDAAAAAVISWEARGDAISAGATKKPHYRTRGWS